MKKKNRITTILTVILCISCLLTGCNGKKEESDPAETLVLSVGESDVYLNEVNYYTVSFFNSVTLPEDMDLDAYYSEDYPTMEDALKDQVLSRIRQTKVLYLKAIEEGITLSEADEARVKELVDEYIKSADAQKLERLGLDQEVLTQIYTQMQMIMNLESQVAASAEGDKSVSYGTIDNLVFLTIEVDEDGNAVVDEDGNYVPLSQEEQDKQRALAEEAQTKLNEGASAEDLIEEYGLSATSGEVHAETESLRKTYHLQDGEVSEILENDFGYTVVKMVALEDEDYTNMVHAYNTQSAAQDLVKQQESTWFEEFPEEDMHLEEEVWDAFTLKDFL